MTGLSNDPDARAVLAEGAFSLDVALGDEAAGRMLAFLDLLGEWNRAYNLTAVTDPQAQIVYHLLDSLSVLRWLCGDRVADIGTGAGLPGIPLAIAAPGRHFTLVDSRAKKTRFLGAAVRSLGLENVEIVTSRIEDYRPQTRFDTVVARALASLRRLAALGGGLLAPGGKLLAMKGRDPVDEIRELAEPWRVSGKHRLVVPGLEAERHLVVIEKNPNA